MAFPGQPVPTYLSSGLTGADAVRRSSTSFTSSSSPASSTAASSLSPQTVAHVDPLLNPHDSSSSSLSDLLVTADSTTANMTPTMPVAILAPSSSSSSSVGSNSILTTTVSSPSVYPIANPVVATTSSFSTFPIAVPVTTPSVAQAIPISAPTNSSSSSSSSSSLHPFSSHLSLPTTGIALSSSPPSSILPANTFSPSASISPAAAPVLVMDPLGAIGRKVSVMEPTDRHPLALSPSLSSGLTSASSSNILSQSQSRPPPPPPRRMDGTLINQSGPDETSLLLKQFFQGAVPPPKNAIYDISKVPQDDDGVQDLMEHGCYRAVVQLASKLLKMSSTMTPMLVRTATYLVGAELRLRQAEQAKSSLALWAVGTMSRNVSGCAAAFSMELMRCEVLHALGQTDRCIAALYSLKRDISDAKEITDFFNTRETFVPVVMEYLSDDIRSLPLLLGTDARDLDTRYKQTLLKLANYHTQGPVPNASAAVEVLGELIGLCVPEGASGEACSPFCRVCLYGLLGKIYLQVGALAAAIKTFDKMTVEAKFADVPQHTLDIKLNSCMILIVRNRFADAFGQLSDLLRQHPTNELVINNFAVCALYTNNVTAAVESFESIIRLDPLKYTRETILFNLRHLYELSSPRPIAKKRVLDQIATLYGPDDVLPVRQE